MFEKYFLTKLDQIDIIRFRLNIFTFWNLCLMTLIRLFFKNIDMIILDFPHLSLLSTFRIN